MRSPHPNSDLSRFQLVGSHVMAQLSGLSTSTLKNLRLREKALIKGIHWFQLNSRNIKYCAHLVLHFLHHRDNPEEHLKEIKRHQTLLQSREKFLLLENNETEHGKSSFT